MADIYSRLGFYAGIDMNFPKYGKVLGGVAASTTVFMQNNEYTNFIPNEDRNWGVNWNYSAFPGLKLPLRYGLEGTFKLPPLWKLIANGKIEAYSDPFFSSDFYNRSESSGLADLLNRNKANDGVTVVEKTNLTWLLNSTLDLSDRSLAPYINQLRISKMNLEFYWNSKAAANTDSSIYYNYEPTRKFYYPSKLSLPAVQLDISGSLLQLSSKIIKPVKTVSAQPTASPLPDPGMGIHSPFGSKVIAKKEKKPTREELKLPQQKADRKGINNINTDSQFNLEYNLRPNMLVENFFINDTWATVDDIDFAMQYAKMKYQLPVSLNYNSLLYGNLLNLSGSLRFDLSQLDSYKADDIDAIPDSVWTSYLNSDKQNSSLTFTNTQAVSLKPFIEIYELQNSLISYNITWQLFSHKYDLATTQYTDDLFKWDNKTITAHNLNFSFVFSPDTKPYKLNLNNQLAPLDKIITASLEFYIWEISNSITNTLKEIKTTTDGVDTFDWKFDPLIFQSTFNYFSWLNFSEKISYDMDEYNLTESNTGLKLFKINNQFLLEQELIYNFKDKTLEKSLSALNYYNLRLSFLMSRQTPLYYSASQVRWLPDNPDTPEIEDANVKFFKPAEFTVLYNYQLSPVYFWKNRMNLSSNINTNWLLNFNTVTDSKFTITANLNFAIYKFLELQFSASSYNNRLYKYFPALQAKVQHVDPELKDIVIDLLKSFNFLNIDDRQNSDFKMRYVTIKLVHHLEDWDFTLDFTGKYEKSADGTKTDWSPVFSFLVEWMPIPELKKGMTSNKDVITFN